MHKQLESRLVASLVAVALCGNAAPVCAETDSISARYCQTPAVMAPEVEERKLLLAHHGCASPSLGAVDLLGTEPGGPGSEALTDSLWGNLILQMAYARDMQLGRSTKKMRLTDNLTLASIYGISGVSLAQSVTSLAMLNRGAESVRSVSSFRQAQAESAGESAEGAPMVAHDHDTHATATNHGSHNDSAAPGVLGLIASGSTLLALGLRFYFGHRYSRQAKRRHREIKESAEAILIRLENGESPEQLRGELEPLIGKRATREFAQLWRFSHQVAAAGASG